MSNATMQNHQVQFPSQTFTANEWLRANGMAVAQALFPEGTAEVDMRVTPIVSTYERLVLKVDADQKSVVVKAFNSEHRRAVAAHVRELTAVHNLRKTGLCPALVFWGRDKKWIMSEFVDGPLLEDVITADNVVAYAQRLGAWYRQCIEVFAEQSVENRTTWLDYLKKYRLIDSGEFTAEQVDFLSKMPIRKHVVAKNDSSLRNFIIDDDGELLGIDFEKSQFKPYGFDILVTGRLLVRDFPHMMPQVTEALVSGFGRGTDEISREDLLKLTQLFSVSTAYTVVSQIGELNRGRLRKFNARSNTSAARIVEVPFMTDAMADQDPRNRSRMSAHLHALVAKPADVAENDRVKVSSADRQKLEEQPDDRESSLCGTCQGACCRHGAAAMAFLDADVLHRTQEKLGMATVSEVITYYVDLMPERHVTGSCYFHTETGCAIPRAHRSDTCNSYNCHAIQRLRGAVKTLPDDASILAFNASDGVVQRAQVINTGSATDVDPCLLE